MEEGHGAHRPPDQAQAATATAQQQQQRVAKIPRSHPIAVVAHPIRSCILLAACWRTSPAANASKVFIPKV
jgi:hypothetical protein